MPRQKINCCNLQPFRITMISKLLFMKKSNFTALMPNVLFSKILILSITSDINIKIVIKNQIRGEYYV